MHFVTLPDPSGYNILTFAASTDDDEIAIYHDLLRRGAVDGFVLTNTHHADARPAAIAQLGARCVAFGRPWGVRHPQHSWVDVDGASGTSEAVRHLAGLGHTHIGFLGVAEGSGVGDDRYRGWQRAMEGLGLPTKGMVARAEDGIASGRVLAERLLDSPRPPSAFVCVSDAMAVGAIHALEDRGGRPGRDVSVVGFDDSPIASVIRPGLSSLRQPIETVAARLIDLLLAELNDAQRSPRTRAPQAAPCRARQQWRPGRPRGRSPRAPSKQSPTHPDSAECSQQGLSDT